MNSDFPNVTLDTGTIRYHTTDVTPTSKHDANTSQKLQFANAMWDETARLNTVSPAGQMEAAKDDVLPAIPELGLPARRIKK